MSDTNTYGPGKLVASDGDNLILEYFDVPDQTESERVRRSVPRAGLKRFRLVKETRVFWQSDGKWNSGRIDEVNSHGDIYVRGRGEEGYRLEKDLFVRWARPLSNPVGFAAGGLLESPLLADLRRPFLQAILAQRAAARGMKGALSSAIEIHDHQVEIARRVLQDPVQRYLLADEVGLGKTIEAGIILRQLLLDDPKLKVQLILPPFLIGQWKQELRSKFFIQDFPNADIQYRRNDEPDSWTSADLLIVDEAHNLASLAGSSNPVFAARYAKLAEVATRSPRLLMLSATPALNNEPVFLQMLRLLDPAVYNLVSVDELHRRLVERASLGRTFLGLQSHLPAVLLRNRFKELRAELPEDTEVTQLLALASEALDAGDREALAVTLDRIRIHISEVHRVHRRMLRTRRTSALQTTYRVTGRQPPKSLLLAPTIFSETTQLLETWRQQTLAIHEDDPATLRTAAHAFAIAVSLALDPVSLAEWAVSRSAGSSAEQTALDDLANDLAYLNRRQLVAEPIADALSYLFKAREKVVIFCPTAALVTELAEEIGKILPGAVVCTHRTSDSVAQIGVAIRDFEKADSTAIMVADSSAEEGRNFQFANVLVHVGAPPSANKMEQRIGRCDRWQRADAKGGSRSLLVSEPRGADSFSSAWNRILKDGFGVFELSLASLQFAVETATEEAWYRLFTEGISATDRIIESVHAALEQEVVKLREQDALDSIEAGTEQSSVYHHMVESESGESRFAAITHALLAGESGNLRFNTVDDPVHDVGAYDALSRLPGKQTLIPLISLDRLKRDFVPLHKHRGSYLRATAISHPETHLYRYGDPFIDAVSDFLSHDDRGRAFGMWRWRPDWGYGEKIAYRFDFAIEANPVEPSAITGVTVVADNNRAKNSLAHRADELFPPLIATIWIDIDGNQVGDPKLLNILHEAYTKPDNASDGGDFSLNRHRLEAAYNYVPAFEWSQKWHEAEAVAVDLIRSLPDVTDAIVAGLERAVSNSAKRVHQLTLRASLTEGKERLVLENEAATEVLTGNAMTSAIKHPTLRLDSTGIVIITGESLARGEDE